MRTAKSERRLAKLFQRVRGTSGKNSGPPQITGEIFCQKKTRSHHRRLTAVHRRSSPPSDDPTDAKIPEFAVTDASGVVHVTWTRTLRMFHVMASDADER